MDIIFLAAGRGLRMGGLTDNIPKALIALPDGRSILETNLANVAAVASKDTVTVVGGYCWDALSAFCESDRSGVALSPVLNKQFADAGPIRSVAAALDSGLQSEHIVIANGDTIFSTEIFALAREARPGVSLIVSEGSQIDRDDMAITWDSARKIVRATKGDTDDRTGHLSAGFMSVRGAKSIALLSEAVEELSRLEVERGKFLPWHELLPILYGQKSAAEPIDVPRAWWREFDYEECVQRYAVGS